MSTKTQRVALYARVSTDGQTEENQLAELRSVAARNGWIVVGEYVDHGISGTKGRDQRPAFSSPFWQRTECTDKLAYVLRAKRPLVGSRRPYCVSRPYSRSDVGSALQSVIEDETCLIC
jgi:hypothetical protein